MDDDDYLDSEQAASVERVNAWLDGWMDTVDFTLAGRGQALGLDIIHTIAMGIQKRASQDKCDSDHVPWEENAEPYATQKEKLYGWVDQPNYRTGFTFSLANLLGTSHFTKDEVIFEPGLPIAASSSVSPTGYISAADRAVTGRQKLEWCHEQTRNRPMRPAIGLSDEDIDNVVEACSNSISDHVIATNNLA